MKKQVLVINYHRIDTGKDEDIPAIEKVFAVTKSSFENQVKILVDHKIPVVSLYDLINDEVAADFAVAITIDDGNFSDLNIIYPVLKTNKMTATFFLLTGKPCFFTRDQAHEMIADGFAIASHGISHRDLKKLSATDQKHELEFSKRVLEEETNLPVDFFSFPFGSYNNRTIEQSGKAGYKAVLTTDARLNYPDEKPFVIHRWSVKRSTTLKEFEEIVTNKIALKRLIVGSKIKKFTKQIFGRSFSDRLNILIHTGRITPD